MSFHRQRDVLRRTVIHAVIACGMAAVLSFLGSLLVFGTDPSKSVSVADATVTFIVIAVLVAGFLASTLTYKSSLTLQRLALIRAELWRVSRTDQLTGLLNRRGFAEAAETAIESASQKNIPTVAMMCDVDRFKTINDKFGHQFGDAVLVEIGGLLNSYAKDDSVIVGRHGGEEFSALLIGSDAEKAMQTAESIRAACAAKSVLFGGISTQVTISIGLSSSNRHPILVDTLLRDADIALYYAKENGRNKVSLAPVADRSIDAERSPSLCPRLIEKEEQTSYPGTI